MAVLLEGAQLPLPTPGRAVAHISHCHSHQWPAAAGKSTWFSLFPSQAFSPPVHLLGHTETMSASPFIKLPPVAVLQWELGSVQLGPGPHTVLSWELGPALQCQEAVSAGRSRCRDSCS